MNNEERKIRAFTDLNAWKTGHELVLEVYKIVKTFPKEELFGLTSQIKRSAVSITSNIAEGFSRMSYQDKSRLYSIAQGSLTELQNQLIIAKDVQYIPQESFKKLYEQSIVVHKITNGLIRSSMVHNS